MIASLDVSAGVSPPSSSTPVAAADAAAASCTACGEVPDRRATSGTGRPVRRDAGRGVRRWQRWLRAGVARHGRRGRRREQAPSRRAPGRSVRRAPRRRAGVYAARGIWRSARPLPRGDGLKPQLATRQSRLQLRSDGTRRQPDEEACRRASARRPRRRRRRACEPAREREPEAGARASPFRRRRPATPGSKIASRSTCRTPGPSSSTDVDDRAVRAADREPMLRDAP